MKVFLDTNVILDYYLNRDGFSDNAEAVLSLGYGRAYDLYVSALTFANMAYICRKKFPGDRMYSILESVQELANVAPMEETTVSSAIKSYANDFEDALQYFSALAISADCIVTRNTKDFTFSEIEVLSPSDFLSKYNF